MYISQLQASPAPLRTLLVGVRGSFVDLDGYKAMLRRYGLAVEWEWSGERNYGSTQTALPFGCEAVVLLFELQMNAHGVADGLRLACEVERIPCVLLSYKKALACAALERLGFQPRAPEQPTVSTPTIAKAPPTSVPSLADLKRELKATLAKMRDLHHVIRVTFDVDAGGVEIERRETIVESLDE